jgi:hypothetical protein
MSRGDAGDQLQDALIAAATEIAERLDAPLTPDLLELVYINTRNTFCDLTDAAVSRVEGDGIVNSATSGRFRLADHLQQQRVVEQAAAMSLALEDRGDAILKAAQSGRYLGA